MFGFLKRLFRKKSHRKDITKPKVEKAILSPSDFWEWFESQSDTLYTVLKSDNINFVTNNFFDTITPKLHQIKDGIYLFGGVQKTKDVADLYFTGGCDPTVIPFIEDIIAQKPKLENWNFVALKQPTKVQDLGINYHGYTFNEDNILFTHTSDPKYPDNISIYLYHKEYTEENKEVISHGLVLFLEHLLGELQFLEDIDSLEIRGIKNNDQELTSISKLPAYINWRKKEFSEKYDGYRYHTEDDEYSLFNGIFKDKLIVSVINSDLLKWDRKPSHPWICTIMFKYANELNNGLPTEEQGQQLTSIEEEIMLDLIDMNGHLNIGRETGNGYRVIYFAGNDFRLPAKVFYHIQKTYTNQFEIAYDIYKDKYWQSFERFVNKD